MKNRSKNRFTTTGKLPLAAALASCALFTAGCANMQTTASDTNTLGSAAGMIQGSVKGGNQPVSGATVTLYSVSQSGQGTSGVTLATATTNAGGAFQFAQTATPSGGPLPPTAMGGNAYECGTGTDPLLYVIARGGNTTGAGTATNSAAAFIAPVGYCSTAASQNVNVTEVTTAAMIAATGQFMNPSTEAIGADGIGVAYAAIGHAFATVATLANQTTGQAQMSSTKTAGNTVYTGGPFYVNTVTVTATPESAKLNTVANILSACINQATATSGTGCSTLFTNAVPPAASHTSLPSATFSTATDTIQAALYMFLNPTDGSTTNRTALYNLSPAAAPFQPTLAAVPTDWTIGVTYTSTNNCANVSSNSNFFSRPDSLAIDATGNVWVSNSQSVSSALSAITANGAPYACLTFGNSINAGTRSSTVIDDTVNYSVYYADNQYSNMVRFTPATGAIQNFPTPFAPRALTADGADSILFSALANGTGTLYRFAGAATNQTPSTPGTATLIATGLGTTPDSIFPDVAGDVWVASGLSTVTQVASSVAQGNINNYVSTAYPVSSPATSIVLGPSSSVYTTSTSPDVLTVLNVAGNGYATRQGFPTAANFAGEIAPKGIYIDGAKNSWIANGVAEGNGSFAISEVAVDGTATSATGAGFQKAAAYLNAPHSIIVDSGGNVWITNDGNATGITELVGAAVPVYQPYARAIQLNNGYYFQALP